MTDTQCSNRSKKHLFNLIKGQECSSCNFALLIGAGASVSSKIKPAKQMIEEMRLQLYKNTETTEPFDEWISKQKWYKKENEYSRLFELIYDSPVQRREYIEDCIAEGVPSWGYIYLANIIARGFFNVIFTTNFDDLLNEACFTYAECKSIVCAHDSAVSGIRIRSKRPKIIKLHGDFLYDNLKNTILETENLEKNMRDKLAQFSSEYGLIVIGYSGNDNSVMDTLEMLVKTRKNFPHGLYWCKLKGNQPNDKVERLLMKDNTYLVDIDGFDEFMAELHEALKLDLPISVKDPYSATTKRLNKFVDLQVENEIIKRDMSSLDKTIEMYTSKFQDALSNLEPFYFKGMRALATGQYQIAADYLEKALEIDPKDISIIRNLGETYLIIGQIKKAGKMLDRINKIIPRTYESAFASITLMGQISPDGIPHLFAEISNLATKSDQYLNLHISYANQLLKLGKYNEALIESKKALAIDPNRSDAKLNKAIAMKNTGDKSGAEDIAKEVLSETKGRSSIDYFHRAYAYALLKDVKGLKHALKMLRGKNHYTATRCFLFDPDFNEFRDMPEFKEFLS